MLRRLTRLLTLAAALTTPSMAHAQRTDESPRPIAIPDPTWDGAVKGALLGAGAMAGTLTVLYARCDAGCEAPAEGPMYAWGLGVGAGSGAAVGWLIDKLHTAPGRSQTMADSARNGIAIGASLGALAGLAAAGVADERCGPFCNRPESQTYLLYGGIGAGGGAATGWLIDKLHAPRKAVPAVAFRADRREKAVRVAWSF